MIKKLAANYQFDEGKAFYQVGMDEVTKIDYEDFSPEPYCSRRIYRVFKNEKLFCEVYDTVVAEAFYT